MPFKQVSIKDMIEHERAVSPEFKAAWDNSRMEYRILGELVKLRKNKGLSQTELAARVGSNQRVISRIEKHEESPTLKTLCNWAMALDVDIQLVNSK